jgi:hypothetical protein
VTLYSVYEPGTEAGAPEERAQKFVFVKEGFCWPALFIPLIWLLYRRLWLEFVLFLLVLVAIPLAIGTGPEARGLVSLASFGASLILAFEANDLRRWALERRGYKFMGLGAGKNQDEAELSYLRHWLGDRSRTQQPAPPSPPPRQTQVRPIPDRTQSDEVIGLFPKPD